MTLFQMVDNQNQATVICNLKRQIGQLVSAQNIQLTRELHSETEANSKSHVNIVMLRNEIELVEAASQKRKQVTFAKT